MGFRFRRTMKVAPGLKINVSKKSIGASVGTKGAHVSLNTKGDKTTSVGLPGTGMSYVTRGKINKKKTGRDADMVIGEDNRYTSADDMLRAKYSPKTLERFSKVFVVLGIILALMSFLLLLASPLFGICGLALGGFILYQAKRYSRLAQIVVPAANYDSPVEKDFTEVKLSVESSTVFPDVDDKGMKVLKILDDVRLSGVTKEHEGVNPQDIIEMLSEGEEVFFKRMQMKKYPYATLVVDSNHEPIGWIPERFAYQEDIAQRLDDGTTVLGRVNSIYGGDINNSYGISIDIARYTKPRRS